jgi:hypothetical protein
MLGAQGLRAGRDLYRATLAVTRGLGFSGLIQRTAPFSGLLRHTRGCGGSILTRILTGFHHRNFQNVYFYLIYLTFDFTLKSLGRAFQIKISLKEIVFSYKSLGRNLYILSLYQNIKNKIIIYHITL